MEQLFGDIVLAVDDGAAARAAVARLLAERGAELCLLDIDADAVRDTAERARNKFVEIQALIDALDRAISGESLVPVKN